MTVHRAAPRVDRMVVNVDVGDGLVPALVAGTGDDVLLLHGWTLDHRSWTPQLTLGHHARLTIPDRRGFGLSTAPAKLDREWADIDRLAPGQRFVLVGLSQGASVALDYARQRPERVAALVLVGAPLHGVVANDDDEAPIPRDHYAALIRAGDLAAMKADWAAHALARVTPTAQPLLDAMLDDYDGRDLLAASPGIAITGDDIAALAMPVLALAGDHDTPWRRRVRDFIGDTAPQGRSVAIEDAGHLCNLDNPARFNAVLADLILSSIH